MELNYSFILSYIQGLPNTWQLSLKFFVMRYSSRWTTLSPEGNIQSKESCTAHPLSSPTHPHTLQTNKQTGTFHSAAASSLTFICPVFFRLGSVPELHSVRDGMPCTEIRACQPFLGPDVFGWRVSLCLLIRSSHVQHARVRSGSSQTSSPPPLMARITVKNYRPGKGLSAIKSNFSSMPFQDIHTAIIFLHICRQCWLC